MNKWSIDRRTMLRGTCAAISLPLLDIMRAPCDANLVGGTDEATKTATTRAAYLYFPNGVSSGAWEPKFDKKTGAIKELNEWMSPLEDHKEDLFIPRNVWTPRGNGHGAGTATWLTGHDYDDRRIDAGGMSVDQIAAKHLGKNTLMPSLELSTRGEGFFSNSLVRNSISWTSSDRPTPREYEPRVIFDRMFRTQSSGLSDRSVLDQVLEDAKRMKRQSSDADRRKIDEYLESVRSVEQRLKFSQQQSERLKRLKKSPINFSRPEAGVPENHEAYMRLMMDMITLAFWSDATRVCTFMLDHGQSNRYFNFIDGVQGTWHALSHWKDASGKTEDDDGMTSWSSPKIKKEQYNRVVQWHHKQVAYLLSNLKRVQEGDSNLLDNSMIVYGSNLADGHEHESRNLPILVAGKGGGNFESGRSVKYKRATSLSKIHLAVLKNLKVPVSKFGEAYEPLSELTS